QTLLSPAVRDVHAPAVDGYWNPTEGGHAVRQQEGVTLPGGHGRHVIADPCAGFSMNDGNDLGRRMGLDQGPRVERLSPRPFEPDHLGATATGDLDHALTEEAVDPDHDHVSRPNGIDKSGFHPCGSGPR